jgi:hypothetical protein
MRHRKLVSLACVATVSLQFLLLCSDRCLAQINDLDCFGFVPQSIDRHPICVCNFICTTYNVPIDGMCYGEPIRIRSTGCTQLGYTSCADFEGEWCEMYSITMCIKTMQHQLPACGDSDPCVYYDYITGCI